MRLVWTQHALADRDAIFEHLESDSPRAAANVDGLIAAAMRRLLDFPESGRPGRVAGTRELVVPHTPFIAAYIVTADRVRILRVLHGAQVWPDDLDLSPSKRRSRSLARRLSGRRRAPR